MYVISVYSSIHPLFVRARVFVRARMCMCVCAILHSSINNTYKTGTIQGSKISSNFYFCLNKIENIYFLMSLDHVYDSKI